MKTFKQNLIFILSFLFCLGHSQTALADPGDLLTDFGSSGTGYSSLTVSGYNIYVQDIATTSDGKIILAGYTTDSSSNKDLFLAKFDSDGNLDTDFGSGSGYVIQDIDSNTTEMAYALDLTSSGQIVVVGSVKSSSSSSTDILITAFTSSGILDTSFGTSGFIIEDWNGKTDQLFDVEIDSEDSIYVTGYETNTDNTRDIIIGKYSSAGAITKTQFDVNGLHDIGYKIYLTGSAVYVAGVGQFETKKSDFVIARYTTSLSLDTTFGGYEDNASDEPIEGYSLINFDGNGDGTADSDTAYDIGFTSTGKIVLAGISNDGYKNKTALAILSELGILENQTTHSVYDSNDITKSLVIDSDDNIILAGYTYHTDKYEIALRRYDTSLNLDSDFGEDSDDDGTLDGYTTESTGYSDIIHAVKIDQNGRILVAGYHQVITGEADEDGEYPTRPDPIIAQFDNTTCGDSDIDTGESCDDGNTTDSDGCSSTCSTEESTDASGDSSDEGDSTGTESDTTGDSDEAGDEESGNEENGDTSDDEDDSTESSVNINSDTSTSDTGDDSTNESTSSSTTSSSGEMQASGGGGCSLNTSPSSQAHLSLGLLAFLVLPLLFLYYRNLPIMQKYPVREKVRRRVE